MTTIQLDIVEHPDDGGLVAIRVTGLDSLPADPTFRIEPIDDALAGGASADWPAGPRRPVAIRQQEGTTVHLVLGPDVLESPLLLPGTPVTIRLLETPAVTDLVWPAIGLRQPRRRRPVIVTPDLREAESTAAEAKRAAAAAALAMTTATLAAAASRPDNEAGASGGRRPRTQPPELPVAARGGPRLVTNDGTAIDLSRSDTTTLEHAPALSGFARATPPTAQLVRSESKHFSLTPSVAGTALTRTGPPAITRKPKRWRQVAAFIGGMAASLAVFWGLTATRLVDISSLSPTAHAPDVAVVAVKSTPSLRAVVSTAGLSPRGRSSAGVSGDAALALADRHLHGTEDTPRDQGEASFWLRHALSQALPQDAMKWALTQLGTIYAAPEGFEPDFAKARLVWEIAGAMGDPVALCFQAELYAHGLGVPRHIELARALYGRAQNAGGCNGLEAALARLR
jgi:hypothetical protein